MSGFAGGMTILITAASITALYALWNVRLLNKLERKEREERDTKPSASTPV